MRLGVFLALVATGLALDCNVGNVVVEDDIIISKSVRSQPCTGMCSRVVLSTGKKDFIMLSCQENELSIWKYQAEKNAECSATELGTTCLCSESFCSDWKAEENLVPVPEVLDANTTPKCYVGYFSNNGVSTTVNNGATTYCAAGQACAFVGGTMGNTVLEAYLCTTTNVCQQAIGTANGTGTINGDNVQMTCCNQADCTGIVTNPSITVPQTVTQGNNNITCMQGAQLDYGNIGKFIPLPCSGSCSSVSVKTYIGSGRNRQVRLLDMYTCDPVAVCDAVNLNNGCGNLVLNGTNSLLRGCCCNTNNCIDPTQQPPVFPTKQLKCYTGIYVPSTGYTVGAEMTCSGKCGRIDVPIGDLSNQVTVKYMSCFPYSICQGLGIGDGDQSYNPPMEEETTVTCCSSKDNCNISPYDVSQISYNVSVIPTTNYPILCYGNIHLNGVPMTTGSYSMCSGECAMANFSTIVYGQQHNTTIYTCDPATMCKAAGITNGCANINGTGVTACCCDDDTCFDPNRVARTSTKCYTGIYVKEDNYLNGGETLCDGWCASLSTIVNNKNATTYWCAPVRVCRSLALGMGGDQNCQTIPNANTPLTGCCCAEGNNCNLPTNLLPNVTSLPTRKEPPIICYEAIHINGVAQGNPGYRVCNGNCVSMTMGAKVNGSAQSTTLYTCDSSASCNAMGLRNGCGSVDGTVYSCCCDSDACIDPNFNRSPDRNLNCYVGVNSPMVFAGTMVQCNGRCANITTSIGNTPFSTYHCVPNSFCSAVALDNACDVLQIDRALTGCCCDSSDGCNALGTNLTTAIPVSPPETPIACYSGLHINHQNWTAGSGWSTCMGDCMVLSINSSFNGQYMTASMYTCDPTTICTSLNMTNRCHQLEPGVEGCCCSESACIDPTKNPPKFPRGRPLTCYNGVVSGYNNLSAGAEQSCDGSCASLSSMVNGVNFTVFSCVPKQICSQLGLYDACNTIQADRAITGCCCDNADNCNILGYNVPPPAPREHDFPIVCFQGIFLNKRGISIAGWQTCMGDCALVSFNTTLNGTNMQADWYTCDPAAVCHQLNVVNKCQQVEPGISGCCCETDACIDPTRFPPKLPGPPLKCYVGVKTVQGRLTNIDVGAETYCDGMCGNIHGLVGTYNVSTYFCAPMNLCRSLELNNNQRQLPGDRAITAYCCDTGDNCNVRDPAINTTRPVSPPEYPVSCYSGVFVNGNRISDVGWMACNGDCALLSMNSTLANGTSVNAELYTCDPTSVCRGLNLTNSCATVEAGLMGCCCDSNGCLDPTRMPPKRPGQLYCYAGIQSDMANVSTGAAVACNGKCGSLNGNLAGYNVSIFACVDSAVCRGLNLYDDCTVIPGDREVRACCCDNYSYCNTRRHNITNIPPPNPNTEFPISCWNGLRLNGQDITAGRWQVCNGDCASIQMNTTVNGASHSLSLYACDPTSVCTALKTRNACNNIEPGLYGCCCDTDGCINPMKNKSPDNPLTCFVGVQSNYNTAFAAGVGATVFCNGRCASLQGQVGGYNTTTFHCVDTSICKYLQLDNACGSLSNSDREVQACCCDNGPACNVVQAGVSITPPAVQNSTEPYIACYSGIWLNGNKITPGSYQACQGDCASVEINTVLNGFNHTATLYTCDPSAVCRSLNTTNNCGILEPGLKGCCCDSDACIDPTNNRSPDRSVYCYVGVYNGALNNSIGDQVLCDRGRRCMSLSTKVNGNMMKAYACVAQPICAGLGIDGTCTTTPNDQAVTACCCDSSNMCNVGTEIVGTNIPQLNFTGNPIACWSGLYVNGYATGMAGWSNCNGDCAAIQLTTTALGMNNTATLYTCDPATVCKQLNIDNTCGTLDQIPGLTGCCCSSDACLDANSIVPKSQQMACYAGVVTSYSSNPGGIMAGAPVKCNGRCASLTSTVSGYNVTVYQCISTNICQMLGIDGTCNTIYQDRAITGCCCSNSDYCNIQGTGISPPRFMNYTEPVIACYNGLWLNNAPIADGGYTGCNGKCSSISLNTTVNGTAQSATLYTCDPATVCSQLNLTNTCGTPEPGISGCCCDSDACIDPNYNRYPGRGLTCYVGVWNGATKQSMGVDSTCDGKCASISTYVNNQKYKAYFCLNQKQAETLNVDNGCRRIPADREIQACVCDNANNCNVNTDENVLQNPVNSSFSGNPIACWNGLYINGFPQGSVGWNGCRGMCASAQWQTSLNGTNHTLTFYTCDPAAACSAMGLVNSCGQVDAIPGLTGCCCSSDACMDANSIYPKSQNLNCYAGIVTPWSSNPGGIMAGASVKCSGRCASLSSTLNGNNFTAYQCISTNICQTLGIDGSTSTLTADRDITGSCCSTGDYCNIAGTNIPVPNTPNYTEPTIACYSGLWVNGNATAVGGYTGCQGKCASISLTTTLMGTAQTATLYTCDPATVCSQLNLTNSCGTPEPGVKGCCCDSDACIDPNYNRSPDRNLKCYVGAWNAATNGSIGDYTSCNGKCASISTYQSQKLYKLYFCLNAQQTESLGVDNGCRQLPSDRSINACVCDDKDNCNIKPGEYPATNAVNITYDAPPITCWSGAYVNGQKQGSVGWVGCTGNCASIQFNTTYQGTNNILVLYTCDPAAACKALGLSNQCNGVDAIPGLQGCCCDQNACMTSDSIYPKLNNNNGNGSSSSVLPTTVVIAFTAVYTLLRQD